MTNDMNNEITSEVFDVFLDEDHSLPPLKATILDEFVVVEGDIIVAKKSDYIASLSSEKGLIITPPTAHLWPNGVMKFQREASLKTDVRIINAMKVWTLKTGITFALENDSSQNHVYFQTGSDCSANVGMIGKGRQYITLSPYCSEANVVHEIGHSLGLLHEHTRGDRDKYIEVFWSNIEPDKVHNFVKRVTDTEIYGKYDFDSIMHYGRNYFSANGYDTIRRLDGKPIERNSVLSTTDIATIKESYFQQELPCGYHVCEDPWDIELGEIIQDCVKQPYELDISLNNSKLIIRDKITKVKNLTVSRSSKIEFDLNQDVDERKNFHAIIIEKLTVERVSGFNSELDFGWHGDTIFDLLQGLSGELGVNAKAPTGRGSNGFPGLTGSRGGTRHAPSIFVFIKELQVPDDTLGSVNFKFLLRGLPGGAGGRGGDGSDGNRGKSGKDGRNGAFGNCRRGGSDGRQGGNPGKGGKGSDAGCGGSGANVNIYYGDNRVYDILSNSLFDLDGYTPASIGEDDNTGPGMGGAPGEAGKEGAKGKKGSRAGNCKPIRTNFNGPGSPRFGTVAWRNWNLGFGNHSTKGKGGVLTEQDLDEVSSLAFVDPLAPITKV